MVGHQAELGGGSLQLRHVELQLRQQGVLGLVEDVDHRQRQAPGVRKHHPLFLPLLPGRLTQDLCAGRRVPGHQLDVGQAGAQRSHAPQQGVVIATEEGVQRGGVGQEDADGHAERGGGTPPPRPLDGDHPARSTSTRSGSVWEPEFKGHDEGSPRHPPNRFVWLIRLNGGSCLLTATVLPRDVSKSTGQSLDGVSRPTTRTSLEVGAAKPSDPRLLQQDRVSHPRPSARRHRPRTPAGTRVRKR